MKMVPLLIILTTVLIQLSCGYNEDLYPLTDPDSLYTHPEDFQDDDLEVHRRNSNFLRFGRGRRYDPEYDVENEDFARPTRSGHADKNDLFIRFGRSKQDFLRFGRDSNQYRSPRDIHLRFGRSAEEKSRTKREAYPEFKRAGSNFLRFGRNSNFLRFGRNEMGATADPETARQDLTLIQMLQELVENIKKQKENRV